MRYGLSMPAGIHLALDIEAPISLVWEVVTDLPRYGEWNPFVVRAVSSLAVGDPIAMHVRVLPFFAQPQRETILDLAPQTRVCWGVPGHAGSPIRSRRCQEMHADGDARTRYVSDFALAGWLAPVVMTILGGRLRAGFEAMTNAVKERAELLQRARVDAPPSTFSEP